MPASSSPLSSELLSPEQRVERFRHLFATIEEEVGQVIVGQRRILRKILTAFFAGGHVLIESVPGLGKTLMAKSTQPGPGAERQADSVHARPHAV